ncbi:MAG: cytidylate kinase family protein [Spirochaetaceae bacterium]|nr:MAG: cytidylate kinase family protein [Spirochaetaceae bacterium]
MVTISRQAGSGGDEIARFLAKELEWDFLDKEALERLLTERGFPMVEFEIYDERKPGLWHRFSAERDRYLHFLKMVSYDFARQGSCVILGRGGQIMFRDVPGAIHVRVVAPLHNRVEAVREKFAYDERRARHAVQHEDNERAGFHRFLFHANWDSPDLYDLIISTRFISEKSAADLIMNALDAEDVAAVKKQGARKLEDLYLAQRVSIAVLYEQQLPIHLLEIEAVDGVITLKGTAGNRESIGRCETVAADVPGVTSVINEVSFVPEYVGV